VLGEAAHLGQAPPEGHEVVVGLLDGIAHQVVDEVADVREVAGRHEPGRGAVLIGEVPQAELDPGQLVLLGHVVEQVPPQVAAVVISRWRRGEAEERRFHAVHDADLRYDIDIDVKVNIVRQGRA
jgi:hypothetical protein